MSVDGKSLTAPRLQALATRYGTPLYAYDAGAVRKAHAAVRSCFPPLRVSYSFKANPNPHIAALLCQAGAAADVTSGGELRAALAAGFTPADISFGGPAKNTDELAAALSAGVKHFIIESPVELDRLAKLCRRIGKRVQCSIRLNTFGGRHEKVREEMTGPPTKFGFDRAALAALFAVKTAKPAGCELCGIHVYNASGILDERLVARNLQAALAEARRVAVKYKMPLKRFTFGPGLGVAYLPKQRDLDMKALSRLVKPILAAELDRDIFRDTTLQLELGRYLVANAGVFLTRVLDVKTCRGKRFIVTDGGINHFLRPVLMGHNHPTEIVGRSGRSLSAADVCGPLCTPIDTIARNVRLPHAKIGDLVAIRRAGAYGCTMGMLWFLGHRTPAEVLVDGKRDRVIRRRSGFGDALANIPPLR